MATLFFFRVKNSKLEKSKPADVKLEKINKQSLGKFTGSNELKGVTTKVTVSEVRRTRIPKYWLFAVDLISRAYIY